MVESQIDSPVKFAGALVIFLLLLSDTHWMLSLQ